VIFHRGSWRLGKKQGDAKFVTKKKWVDISWECDWRDDAGGEDYGVQDLLRGLE
jgi:hypothetical protein